MRAENDRHDTTKFNSASVMMLLIFMSKAVNLFANCGQHANMEKFAVLYIVYGKMHVSC
jgi:hypothetical protein